jgi:AcrR family transcriptional regulator
MTAPTRPAEERAPLSAERVIDGAVGLADEIGIDAFTIRKLAEAIDVKPMTIYHHLPNKEAIIDGMVDRVFDEIDLPPTELDWRAAMVVRCRSMRRVLADHPWASPLMESRTNPGPATLRHHDAVLGCLRLGGFSLGLTAHAYATIDAFLYGFALQEATLPATGGAEMDELAGSMVEAMPTDELPHLVEFTLDHVLQPGYEFSEAFEFGLGVILDGLQHAVDAES